MGASDVDPDALHRSSFVFDGHNDLALRILEGDDPAGPLEGGHLDVPRMRAGGFDGGVFAVWMDPSADELPERTRAAVRRVRGWVERTDGVRLVLRAGDLAPAKDDDGIAVVLGVEGGYAIGDDASAVDALFEAGVRCLTLTWMEPTGWADAAGAEPRHGGLAPPGRDVVARLEALGVAVDLSHAADTTVRDVLDVMAGPPLVSHSGLRALADHPRNLPDELLVEVAGRGGVLGVNFFPGYLDEATGRAFEALRREVGVGALGEVGRDRLAGADGTTPSVGLERVVDHLEHALSVAGSGAVGLGSDFDGVPVLPDGLPDVAALPALTSLLLGRGIPAATVRGVLGGNLRRLFRQVLPGGEA
ncbi:MAG: dipeptidase [Gemmatimonadota bacterium]